MSGNLKKEFCTSREAADQLGVSLRTIQLWVESGILDAWKTAGGHRRIVKASVEKYICQQHDAIEESKREAAFRILIVEDEQLQLEHYRVSFNEWSLPVQLSSAADGFEGLLLIGQEKPDLIITDINLAGIDGVRMVRALLAQPARLRPQVIVTSSLGGPEIASLGGLPRGVPLQNKPIDFEQLRVQVLEAIARRHHVQPKSENRKLEKPGLLRVG